MVFSAAAQKMPDTSFEIRQIGTAEFEAARIALGDSVMDGYARTLGKPDFHHYLLFDAGRPIALAALVKFGEIGYLTYAGTVEPERRRGAQSALIAHRVAAAQSMGCTHIVSQTLTMLEDVVRQSAALRISRGLRAGSIRLRAANEKRERTLLRCVPFC